MNDLDIPRTHDHEPADSSASVAADKYDQMLALADLFDSSGNEMRTRARLGAEILGDDDVVDTGELSPATWAEAEEDIRAATTGKHGLLTRSVELDADALVVRATVLTYRWIDELQEAAYKTLGSIAGRAIGYLAPEVALGGAIVSAGLIETETMDRDGVTAYLSELAENNPDLMEHLSGGGGLLDGLHMRSLLTAGVLASDQGAHAARGGLRAIGIDPFPTDAVSAFRDSAGSFVEAETPPAEVETSAGSAPRSLEELMATLLAEDRRISVQRVGTGRYIAYLPGSLAHDSGRLRLVGADPTTSVSQVVRAIEEAVTDDDARVMLVGSASGGTIAAEIAASARSSRFVVDQVVTAGAPSAQVPRIPEATRVLSLEDRSDPVVLLGSLINAATANRLTVVFDADGAEGTQLYVAGARAADSAEHPELRAEISRMHELGFLTG
ncbi:hypothetical protein [Nocardioides sp. zg-1228]|uniref:hypothetical protein n=1 Tax=Nocardioides sp. zg-1228 TaxID=2763008 RepID=UPI001643099C|nr:hypothetical protein [Nocardioides sp. zg-1228]MBC2932376.1 hypothetical protein [Nocardioides sp. zg-1228]QSF57889.1 hypothetical protein JX575_01240 [Nocardioides sp. zg-1228]